MTTTRHRVHFTDSADMGAVESNSVNLVVTSPPYPMVEMWDNLFSSQDPAIKTALLKGMSAICLRDWLYLLMIVFPYRCSLCTLFSKLLISDRLAKSRPLRSMPE